MSSPSLITAEEKSPSVREAADETSCTNSQSDPRIDKQENLNPGIASSKLNADQQAAREKKMERLQNSISRLQEEVISVEQQIQDLKVKLKNPNAEQTVQRHIQLLHSYNEIKDVGQGLLGLIADARGCRYVDILEEFELSAED